MTNRDNDCIPGWFANGLRWVTNSGKPFASTKGSLQLGALLQAHRLEARPDSNFFSQKSQTALKRLVFRLFNPPAN